MTKYDFGWLPAERTCDCPDGRLNCLSRREMSDLGSTVLNIQKRHVWKEKHPARFIPELPERYINLFSHKGECVLDPFCGSGTTNTVAKGLGRNSIAIDINPASTKMARSRLDGISDNGTRHQVLTGDVRRVLKKMKKDVVDLVVTSPPYYDVIDYNDDSRDQFGNVHDYDKFLDLMSEAFKEIARVLKPSGFICVNTQDVYKKNVKACLHTDFTNILRDLGIDIYNTNIYILNYSTGGRLVYGYPKEYYPKNDHEFVIIFRK
jgi:DNA modification methylase